jgi:Tol biopolymer transport system component/DNA-binding winged helix-turn-helix (wHTH) protein
MSVDLKQVYEFGPYRLDTARALLLREGQVVPLAHKAFETLSILVRNSGQVVSKDELMKEVWPDAFVEEGSLSRNISVLRKALGESPAEHQYIETIPRQGYRFVATVSESFPSGDLPHSEAPHSEASDNGHTVQPLIAPAAIQPSARSDWRTRGAIILFILIAALAGFAYALKRVIGGSGADVPLQRMLVTRFTTTGRSIDAAISADGRYVAYATDDAGRQALWVKQVATGSLVQIVRPADVSYQGLTFSPDGDYVYYNLWDKKSVGAIYRVPVLGGASVKIVFDCMPSLSISPDGSRVAFVRGFAAEKAQALMTANVDGTDEKQLARREGSAWFTQPAWSPNGKTIACSVGSVGKEGISTVEITVLSAESGAENTITSERWLGIAGLAWLGDGAGLLISATNKARSPAQIWSISYPDGAAHKLTNDLDGYYGLSLTRDSSTLVTVQDDLISNIWVAPGGDSNLARKINSEKYEGLGLAWTPDGRVVFRSWSSGNPDIWIMDYDGSNKRALTSDDSEDLDPTVTPDGRYILFTSNRSGHFHVWRMDTDGNDLKQLTEGTGEWSARCSAGGWVVYASSAAGKQNLWKISIDGGAPVRLTDKYSYMPALSPDGKLIAYSYWDEATSPQQWGREIISLETGQRIKAFEVPRSAARSSGDVLLRWTADGQSLTYIDFRDGGTNLWGQPLNGAPATQLTNFKDDRIFWFDWASNGDLVCSRGIHTSDVVLISNFK